MKIRLSFLLAMFTLALPVSAEINKTQLLAHIREAYQIPPEVDLQLGPAKPSDTPSFDVMDLQMTRAGVLRVEQLYLSNNGRHYFLGGFKDVNVWPHAERVRQMDLGKSPSLGGSNGITIVEYTDFQCPYCLRGYEIMSQKIMKENPGKVKWVYKSLPLKAIHPWAEPAAIAALCVNAQGEDKFWKMHDLLFENQRKIKMESHAAQFRGFAASAGANLKAYDACVERKTPQAAIQRDLSEAQALGINGTPAFVINGHLVSGADEQAIRQKIDQLLPR